MSRPTWRVYDVRSWSWSSAPNTISTCSTVLRSPARTLSTRERTRRPPSWASAQRRSAPSPMLRAALLEHDLVRAESPGGWPSRAGRCVPSRSSVVARTGWPATRARSPSAATSSSTIEASAPSSRTSSVRPMTGRAAPSAQRTTIGRSTRTPAGTWTTTPCGPGRARELGELLLAGQQRRPVEQRAGERLVRGDQLGQRQDADAGGARRPRPRTGRPGPSSSSSSRPATSPRRRRLPAAPRRTGAGPAAPSPRRGAQVDVRRVQAVRTRPAAPRTRSSAARRSSRSQAGSRARVGDAPRRARGRGTRTGRSVGDRRAGRAGRAAADDGSATSVIRATPPSRASRGG